jgi:hypothetical protein
VAAVGSNLCPAGLLVPDVKKEIRQFLKDVKGAQRRYEKREGLLGRYRAQTIPDKRKQVHPWMRHHHHQGDQ